MVKIFVEWDEDNEVAEIRYDGVQIRTHDDFEAWREAICRRLGEICDRVGTKVPLIVNIDGLSIRQQVADDYAALAKEVAQEFASSIARYGEKQPLTGAVVAVAAMRISLERDGETSIAAKANLFPDRASAIAHVKR